MNINITMFVNFSKTQETYIQSSAIIKIKLGRHINDRFHVYACSKIYSLSGNPTNRSRFHR